MFYNAKSLINILENGIHQVTNMCEMFSCSEDFNQPLNNWDVSNVTSTSRMFSGCEKFNQPLNNWNVSNVIYIYVQNV
jgi:surface protein